MSAHEMLDASRYQSIGQMLGDAFVQFKTSTALVEYDRKREKARLSYLELKRQAMRLARRFEDWGIGENDRVAIVLTNQSKYAITLAAAFHRGAVVVPIDYKLTHDEREALLEHAKPKTLVTEYPLFRASVCDRVEHVLVSEAPQAAELKTARRFEDDDASDGTPTFVERTRDDVATIVYSSGTGGRPKGCMLTHGAYLAQYTALTSMYPMVEGDRYFSILPTNHAIDFMCGFFGPLCGGATVVHQRTLRPEFIFDTMKAERITHMAVVPMILAGFERAMREKFDALPATKRFALDAMSAANGLLTERKPNYELSRRLLAPVHDAFGGSLKLLFCGGAFVERKRAEFFYKLGIPVVIGYGLTEACTVATVNDLKPFRGDSVGPAVPGVRVRIDAPNADGVGEVQISGPTVMRGYLDDDALTRESFTEDGWLKTGDLGLLDGAHHLRLFGRRKNMIVTAGGKNVYPEDVENAFADVPCEELCVFASNYLWPTQSLVGEKLVAVVRVSQQDGEERWAGVMDALRAKNSRLPEHKRVSSVLAWRVTFPRTASMKIKREALASELQQKTDASQAVAL